MPSRSCLLLLVLAVPATAAAQDSVTTFRPGQWGTELSAGSGLGNLGVLRFSDARRAWVLDAGGDVSWRSSNQSGSTGDLDVQDLQLRVGRRRYAPLGRGVYRLVTAGIVVGYGRASSRYLYPADTTTSRNWSADGGVFAELGAQWMVNRHFSLGASWGASAAYRRTDSRTASNGANGNVSNRARSNELRLSVRNAGVRGAFYF